MALYRYVARKVSRAKWQPPDHWEGKRATADGITACLKTGSNRLSLWRFANDADLSQIALAMVATADKIETMDLAWLELSVLAADQLDETPGVTPVVDLQGRHVDLCRLDGRQLLNVADQLFDAIQDQCCRRFTQKDLSALLTSALKDGRVTPDELKEKVRQALSVEST